MTSLGTFDVVSFKKSMENLRTIEDIDNVLHFYDEKCCFKDPFHDVQSKSAIIWRLNGNLCGGNLRGTG